MICSMRKVFLAVTMVLGASLAFGVPALAEGPTLYFDPPTAIVPIGEPLTVEVRIDSAGEEIGSTDATIAYDPADLDFQSLQVEGSVFSRTLVDDATNPGRLDLSAFVERNKPAFTGEDGLVARLVFMPKRNAATQLRFAQASAHAPLPLTASVADIGNVLTELQSATYTLVPRESVPAPMVVAQAVGAATGGTSGVVFDPPLTDDGWVRATSVKASWELPQGATALRVGVATSAEAVPDKLYPVPVSSATVELPQDGEQFLVRQFAYGEGNWDAVVSTPLKVDNTPPSLSIAQVALEDGRAAMAYEILAPDDGVGEVSYMVGIDGAELAAWEYPDDGIWIPQDLRPGEHVLTVEATDGVGNATSTDYLFSVNMIEAPILTQIDERVLTGDTITVSGTTFPDAQVTVYASHNENDPREVVVPSDESGKFTAVVTDGARAGTYTVWFTVVDRFGAESPSSIKRSVTVTQPSIILFGSVAVSYLSVVVPLLALIVLLVLIVWLVFVYVKSYRRRVQRETREAFTTARKEFEQLRQELVQQIGMLERANQSRELTREEMRIFTDLSKRLDYIERHIAEEIDDIERVDESQQGNGRVTHTTLRKYQTPAGGQQTPRHTDKPIRSGKQVRIAKG